MIHNPYYSPKELGLELLAIEEQGLSYEYNTLCFWITEVGHIYTASDSGCSCPTPFEQYEGPSQKEVLQKLERVKDAKSAVAIFKAWDAHTNCNHTEDSIRSWIKTCLKRRKTDKRAFLEFTFESGEQKRLEINKVTTISGNVQKVMLHLDKIDDGEHLLIINESLWNVDTDKLKEIKIVKE